MIKYFESGVNPVTYFNSPNGSEARKFLASSNTKTAFLFSRSQRISSDPSAMLEGRKPECWHQDKR